MVKFHFSPDSDTPTVCKAEIKCPYSQEVSLKDSTGNITALKTHGSYSEIRKNIETFQAIKNDVFSHKNKKIDKDSTNIHPKTPDVNSLSNKTGVDIMKSLHSVNTKDYNISFVSNFEDIQKHLHLQNSDNTVQEFFNNKYNMYQAIKGNESVRLKDYLNYVYQGIPENLKNQWAGGSKISR